MLKNTCIKNNMNIQEIRDSHNQILVIGNHSPIIQSILDFDYLSGKKQPSLLGIITGRRGYTKYFWGRGEILLPTFSSPTNITDSTESTESTESTNLWFLNLSSGRRALSTTQQLLGSRQIPDRQFIDVSGDQRSAATDNQREFIMSGGVLFAENVPELHSLELIQAKQSSLLIGPASVGLLVPGALKLGPIGGITPTQINEAQLTKPGNVAVLSASGGMTNELINITIGEGHHLSFALSFGGDRFPILSPREAFLLAEADPQTKTVLYYGELGGVDEYELVKLKSEGKFTKQVIAHIAGTVSSLFPESPQFGHAKAKASKDSETALAKRRALKKVGFQVSDSFSDFIKLVSKL